MKDEAGFTPAKLKVILFLTLLFMFVFASFAYAAEPIPPANVSVKSITGSGAVITWDSVEGATGYKVYLDGTLKKTVGNVTSTVISGLNPETSYFVTVTAINDDGESTESNAVDFTTTSSSVSVNFDMASLFQYAQMIIDVLMPVVYITLGISLGFIVIRALKSAFN